MGQKSGREPPLQTNLSFGILSDTEVLIKTRTLSLKNLLSRPEP